MLSTFEMELCREGAHVFWSLVTVDTCHKRTYYAYILEGRLSESTKRKTLHVVTLRPGCGGARTYLGGPDNPPLRSARQIRVTEALFSHVQHHCMKRSGESSQFSEDEIESTKLWPDHAPEHFSNGGEGRASDSGTVTAGRSPQECAWGRRTLSGARTPPNRTKDLLARGIGAHNVLGRTKHQGFVRQNACLRSESSRRSSHAVLAMHIPAHRQQKRRYNKSRTSSPQ